MRVAHGSHTLGEAGDCLPMHVKTGSCRLGGRDHQLSPTVRKAVPARAVERLEHDKTLRSPGHPLQRGGSPVVKGFRATAQDSFCGESGIVLVQRLSHLKQLHAQMSVHLSFPLKSCGDGVVAKGTDGGNHWKSYSHKPAHRRPEDKWPLVFELDSGELRQHPR